MNKQKVAIIPEKNYELLLIEILNLIYKTNKELRPKVYCKCGKLKEESYDGETMCPVFNELIKKANGWDTYYDDHHNGYAYWDDLAVWHFVKKIEKIFTKYEQPTKS